MRLAAHILRSDLRQFRGAIAAWILLTIATAAYLAVAPRLDVSSRLQSVWFAASVGIVARWLLGVTLVVMMVQAHALVGTTAFWMTRPVAPRVLLQSRLLSFGVLFVAVPALCDAVLMAAHGVPSGAAAGVIAEWSIVRALGVLVVMAAASATATFARFALLAGIVLAGGFLLFAAGMISLTQTSQHVADLFVLPPNGILALTERWPDQTSTVAAWLTAIAGLLVVARSRYRRRSLTQAALLTAGAGIAAMAVLVFWPWPLIQAAVGLPEWAGRGGALRLFAPAEQVMFFDNAGVPSGAQKLLPRWRTAHGRVYLSNLPAGWYAIARVAAGSLQFDGRTVVSGPAPYSVALAQNAQGRDTRVTALEEVLGVETLNGARLQDTSGSLPLLRVLSTDTPVVATEGTYVGEVDVGLHEIEVAQVLAPAPGAEFQDGAYRLTLTGVRLTEGGPRLDVRWSDAASVFDRHPDPRYQVVLRNRRLGEALTGEIRSDLPALPSPESALLGRPGYLARTLGFRIDAGVIGFPSTTAAGLPSARLPDGRYVFEDEPWMRDAELVILRTLHRGVVRQDVRIDRVAINGGGDR